VERLVPFREMQRLGEDVEERDRQHRPRREADEVEGVGSRPPFAQLDQEDPGEQRETGDGAVDGGLENLGPRTAPGADGESREPAGATGPRTKAA
jgi:hypothetical protein